MSTTQIKTSERASGDRYVWLSGMGLAFGLIMVFVLMSVILLNGLSFFWPKEFLTITLKDDTGSVLGHTEFTGTIVEEREKLSSEGDEAVREYRFYVGNKDVYGEAFVFVNSEAITGFEETEALMLAERREGGNALLYPIELILADGTTISADDPDFEDKFQDALDENERLLEEAQDIAKNNSGPLNHKLRANELSRLRLIDSNHGQMAELREMQQAYERYLTAQRADAPDAEELLKALEQQAAGGQAFADMFELLTRMGELQAEVDAYNVQVEELREASLASQLRYRLHTGEELTIPTGSLLRFYYPNQMGFFSKLGYFLHHWWIFLSEEPREANTEGGVFPAIFGTFVMTVMMSAAVMPFGVLAAIYLREYAVQGPFVQAIRIAVNNLAGVPSIVYGVFGLGFFVHTFGGGIDSLFFADKLNLLNEATFGEGGVLWASLTLALLTVPVVVVATEEALAAVPLGMREASMACGASKWQTIQRVVLPASASGILTGLILAMARGAGEVAPLMVVGVAKIAPDLPVDGNFPFIHLDRKFLHLGFHIYDVGFQSPDSEATKPIVFATTLLLISLVIVLNLGAILIREHLRKKYSTGTF